VGIGIPSTCEQTSKVGTSGKCLLFADKTIAGGEYVGFMPCSPQSWYSSKEPWDYMNVKESERSLDFTDQHFFLAVKKFAHKSPSSMATFMP
jgi:hypothetical protein